VDWGWFGGDSRCCTRSCVRTCIRDDHRGQRISGGVGAPCSPAVEAPTQRFNSSRATSSWDTLSLSAAVSEESVAPRCPIVRGMSDAGDPTARVDAVAAHRSVEVCEGEGDDGKWCGWGM